MSDGEPTSASKKRRLENGEADDDVAQINEENSRLVAGAKEFILRAMREANGPDIVCDLNYSNLSKDWQLDRDVVKAALESGKAWWSVLPKEVQRETEVAKIALFHGDAKWWQLPSECQQNIGVAIEALSCDKVRWKDLPLACQQDSQVAKEALLREKVSCGELSRSMQQNCDVTFAALFQQKVQWNNLPPECLLDRDLAARVLQHRKVQWSDFSDDLQRDREVAATAFAYGRIEMADLPAEFQSVGNRSFWMAVVTKKGSAWLSLPEAIKSDVEVTTCISYYESDEIARQVLFRFPTERKLWLKAAGSLARGTFSELIDQRLLYDLSLKGH